MVAETASVEWRSPGPMEGLVGDVSVDPSGLTDPGKVSRLAIGIWAVTVSLAVLTT